MTQTHARAAGDKKRGSEPFAAPSIVSKDQNYVFLPGSDDA